MVNCIQKPLSFVNDCKRGQRAYYPYRYSSLRLYRNGTIYCETPPHNKKFGPPVRNVPSTYAPFISFVKKRMIPCPPEALNSVYKWSLTASRIDEYNKFIVPLLMFMR